MSNFKFTDEQREKYKEALDIGYAYDQVFDEIEQIINERDGWMLKKDAELIEGEAYLVSDGKMVFGTARIAIGGVLRTPVFVDSKGLQYILCECGDFCMPLPSPPKTEKK